MAQAAHAGAAHSHSQLIEDGLSQFIQLQAGLFDETSPHKSKRSRTGAIIVFVAPFQLSFNF
jgi:hypothetical protein